MERLIRELKEVIPFKDTTEVGDIVLIAAKEPHMLVYASVLSIERDTSRRDEWWHIGLCVLALPPQKTTWTLRTPQMTGMETFTMGGEERLFKAVDLGVKTPPAPPAESPRQGGFIKRVK